MSLPVATSSLDLARWQFALTTLLHFAVVGVSIGLVVFVALLQTRWVCTGDERWLRLTKYFGRAMLVVFAVGVVTGIVQTFQLGMNWSGFSRYVGDVFGAPLALEGLAAFFVESTFLGLWIFGWDRLTPRVHLACLWVVAFAAMLSAYAILVANSWMQHPVGYELRDGRAHLTDPLAVMVNLNVALTTAHVLMGAVLTGAIIVLGLACLQVARDRDTDAFASVMRLAVVVGLVAALGTAGAGHLQGVLAEQQQPMKIAAAEALYGTEKPAGLSLFAVGGLGSNPGAPSINLRVPGLLSLIDGLSLHKEVRGITDLQAEAAARYGPGDYVPIVGLMYWSFRTMVGGGMALIALMSWGVWLLRKGRLTSSPLFLRLAPLAMSIPFVAQAGGWILREGGRQPWVVTGLLRTDQAASAVSALTVAGSLAAFLAIYAVIFAAAGRVMRQELGHGLPPTADDDGRSSAPGPARPARSTADLALSY